MAKITVGVWRDRMFVIAQQFMYQFVGPYKKIVVFNDENFFMVDDAVKFIGEKPLVEMPVGELQLRIQALTCLMDHHREQRDETRKILYSKAVEVFVAVVNPVNGISDIIPVSPHGSLGYIQFDFKLLDGSVLVEDSEDAEVPTTLMTLGRTTILPNGDHACAYKHEEQARVWVATHPAVVKAKKDE